MRYLVIVDCQNDFIEGGNLPVVSGKATCENIKTILSYYDGIITTQDFHPVNHGSFKEYGGQ